MSWKGFQKGIVRAPQSVRQKFNMGQVTKDPVYIDAERRFESIEQQTKKLHSESKRYWNAINSLLSHQIEFSKVIEEVYKPISGSMSDPESMKQEGNPEGIAACQQYRELVTQLQQLIKPELEMIESRVLKPADELLVIIQSIKKMFTKRDHKQLDLDRRGNTLKKLQDKPDRTVKEEEKMYKAENDYTIAEEEYNYFNDLLKEELPKLFSLESQFIRPLFQSFYFMQLNIFYTLYMHMEDMKIPYFNLEGDIVSSYMEKHGDIQERCEAIGIAHFKVGHAKAKLEATRRRYGRGDSAPNSPSLDAPPSYSGDDDYDNYRNEKDEYAPKRPPRPGTAKPQQFCTALYDYEAQSDGDLTLKAGDRIEIIQRTDDVNGWWTGNLNGVQGVFPGNYVELN